MGKSNLIIYHTASRGECVVGDRVKARGALVEVDTVENIYPAICVINREGVRNLTPLMMFKPEIFLNSIAVFPNDTIIFHIETCSQPNNLINLIRKKNCRIGVALNPLTPVGSIKNILLKVDLLLIMTVTPGFSGQTFIDSMVNKVREVSRLSLKINQYIDIEVDGGLTKQRIRQLYKAGANVFVAGTSTIFKDRNLEENIQDLRSFTAKLEAEHGVEKN